MFKTQILILSLAALLGLGILIIPCGPKDHEAYQELLKSSTPQRNEALLTYSQQTRGEVRKRVWYQDDTPLHIRIDSQESELFFFRQENKIEVIEQLEKVACIMQEELYYTDGKPMQKVRYMEAEKASYNYNSHMFVAEEVKIWKYQLAGHTPPETIQHERFLMHATAQSVEFSLKGEKLNFTAHQMRATVNSKERAL